MIPLPPLPLIRSQVILIILDLPLPHSSLGLRTVPVSHGPDGSVLRGRTRAVPSSFQLQDGRWTGRSRPVQDRRGAAVTAV